MSAIQGYFDYTHRRIILPWVISWTILLGTVCHPTAAAAQARDRSAAIEDLQRRLTAQEAKVIAARAAALRAVELESRPDIIGTSDAERDFKNKYPQFHSLLQEVFSSPTPTKSESPGGSDLSTKLQQLSHAENTLADLRSQHLARLESSVGVLDPQEIARLLRQGLLVSPTINDKLDSTSASFKDPEPLDFDDHTGFTQIFDGKTLQGWDGDPAIWKVKDGAIVGSSTWEHPIANSYISYHGTTVKDFDLKLEIKVDERGGSGIQYRSAVGIPFSWTVPGVAATNSRWLMTGPQADFWPELSIFNGQVYSENTPLRIIAWRGQVVNSVAGQKPRIIATIGNRTELGNYVRLTGWNQYRIVARGGTLIHILNGQLMAVEIDDDPSSSNNRAGLIGIEIELVPSHVEVRNVWLRKLP